jgi:hypothetical protein
MHDMRCRRGGGEALVGLRYRAVELNRVGQLQLDLGLRELGRASSSALLIEHVPALMDMRRYLVMDEANMPETAAGTLTQLEQRGHPWRGTPLTRSAWMEQMEFAIPRFDGKQEYLFWVGCTGALVERNVKVTQALARLLHKAGVTFGCLGEEETCSGDPARRLGNEYLYQMQATQNIETFNSKHVQKVITTPALLQHDEERVPQFAASSTFITIRRCWRSSRRASW